MSHFVYLVLVLVITLGEFSLCERTPENVTATLLTYERYIRSSLDLEKSDKALLKTWATAYQVNQVNVTSHYRLEMTRHKEHSFSRIDTNQMWLECLSLHESEIKKSERNYYNCETECLKVSSVADHDEKKAVHQVAKEIKKWRKSYKYLANQCHTEYPGNEEATARCLVEYVQRDHYDVTFQRLIILKQKSMADLYLKIAFSSNDLEECLKSCLSQYLNNVRNVMDNLNSCYSIKNKSIE